jgi:signal transduction histidine kinase
VVVWALALLLRRHFPFAAPVFVFVLYGTVSFADRDAVSSLDTGAFMLLLAFWAVGAQQEARQAAAGVAIGCATVAVLIERDLRIEASDGIGEVALGAGLAVAAFVFERRARRAVALEERAVRLEREREERERVAVAEERRRIARDLHDVVAHGVGVMTVQAGAARLLLDDDPGRAREPLLAVEQAGRQALGELRRLLGMLRRDERDAGLRPQPGLADLEELVAQARGAGLPVELVIEGAPVPLPAGVDLAAYRIVQEGLTNTRKHAGPARAGVAVRYGHGALELEISDDGRTGANGGGGHGLVGMRERVALYGGRLEAGPRPDGGFTVRAHLPLEATAHHGSATQASRLASSAAERAPGKGTSLRRPGFDVLVIAVAVFSEVEIWVASVPGPKLVLVPAVLLYTLPLLLRRRFPFAAPACAFTVQAAISFSAEAVGSVWSGLAALLLAFWAVGAQEEARHAVAGAALGFASLAVAVQWDVRLGYSDLLNGVILGGATAVAAFVFERRARRAVALEERAVRLEREREERERVAVAEERRRIARDLHDVVAHGVGVMTVQAGAARLLLDDDPGRAREPLLAVEQAGRQALGELRRLLGMLRRDERDAGLRPQPGLADLEELVAQARGAGLPVELVIEGAPVPLPAGVDLAAYRIVQEGLTNTRKHAGPARAGVAVRYGHGALELEISDDGRTGANGGGGHGLVGMRERVALYGGRLEAGPRPDGGFTVRAHLPLEPARP